MLAHRVAALILAGTDPKRIVLATFSRRAAAELNRRVERIVARRLPAEAAAAAVPAGRAPSTASARAYCANMRSASLDPQFTIHDREDSADLMNWARHQAGLSETRERFPMKARASPSIRVSSRRAAIWPGVGPKLAEAIISAVAVDNGFTAMASLALPPRASAGFAEFAAHMRRLAARGAPWPGELTDAGAINCTTRTAIRGLCVTDSKPLSTPSNKGRTS
jgi:hypothetical protein